VEGLVERLLRVIPKRGVTGAAREIGTSPSYLHDLLNGKKTNPGKALRLAMERYAADHLTSERVQTPLSSPDRAAENTTREQESGEAKVVFESEAHRRLYRLLEGFPGEVLTAVEGDVRQSILDAIERHHAKDIKVRD
jgi:hypothetical protein